MAGCPSQWPSDGAREGEERLSSPGHDSWLAQGALRRESATYVRRPSGASRRSPRSINDPVSLPRRPCEASTRTTHISTAFPAQDTGPYLQPPG